MIIFNIEKTYIFIQAQAIIEKIGYPDYLDSDNVTKLENIYAEVGYKISAFFVLLLL
jgi:hypothetical protein